MLANEGVIFRKERLSNLQISVSDNNLFDSSPELLASICSLFLITLRYSFSSASFPDKSLFDSHFIGFPLLFHCTCFAVTLGHFHPLSFGLLKSNCSVLLATHQLINNRPSSVNCVDSYSAIFAVYQSPFPCRSMISSQPLFNSLSSPSFSFCLTNYVVSKVSDKRISHFCVFHPSFRNFFLSL